MKTSESKWSEDHRLGIGFGEEISVSERVNRSCRGLR